MVKVFYKGAHAGFLVFDVTKKDTFNKLESWIHDFRGNAYPEAKLMLLGNRKDEEESREVSVDEAKEFARTHQLIEYYETSAKTGEAITEAFTHIAKLLFLSIEEESTLDDMEEETHQKLTAVERRKSGCCQ
eukprot:TRINITY_DN4740_c0_g1_i4.p1 TRINITY_DN4740_c0_g1~~TRINITY_DN4740_c0_g1_i4.p1  ORF type:complete len:132 (-),score=29.73 TRINITY_DN4740_c0_g1_i4:151-546(-)